MIVLDANILICAVLGRRVRQLIETYGSHGARFFGRVARTWKIESCRRKNGREYRTLIFFAEVKKRGGCPRLGLGSRPSPRHGQNHPHQHHPKTPRQRRAPLLSKACATRINVPIVKFSGSFSIAEIFGALISAFAASFV
ncbi:MAG: hypothetical protein DMG50_06365 [Acidobacteria bacterium]|nr:MAG: hypothetical protein DMG50_06365 [Acidobacteriota bacterium]